MDLQAIPKLNEEYLLKHHLSALTYLLPLPWGSTPKYHVVFIERERKNLIKIDSV